MGVDPDEERPAPRRTQPGPARAPRSPRLCVRLTPRLSVSLERLRVTPSQGMHDASYRA